MKRKQVKWTAVAAVFMAVLVLFPFGTTAYAKTAVTPVESVDITVSAPAAGTNIVTNGDPNDVVGFSQAPYPQVQVPSGQGYALYGNASNYQPAFWLSEEHSSNNFGIPSYKNGTVAAGETLWAYGCLVNESGYQFVDSPSVAVQGGNLVDYLVITFGENSQQFIFVIRTVVPGEDKPKPAQEAATLHEHNFDWYLTKEPTETEDGEFSLMCPGCGAVERRIPATAFRVFLDSTAKKILEAAPGAEVNIETGRWMSFDATVLDALAARPDVSVALTYRYHGDWFNMTIPAGTDTAALKNEEGYAGFAYLATIFECTPK